MAARRSGTRARVEAGNCRSACNGWIHHGVTAMTDELRSARAVAPDWHTHLVVACLKTSSTRSPVVFPLTSMQSTTQQPSASQMTFVQVVQGRFFVQRLLRLPVFRLIRQRTADSAALVSSATMFSDCSQRRDFAHFLRALQTLSQTTSSPRSFFPLISSQPTTSTLSPHRQCLTTSSWQGGHSPVWQVRVH